MCRILLSLFSLALEAVLKNLNVESTLTRIKQLTNRSYNYPHITIKLLKPLGKSDIEGTQNFRRSSRNIFLTNT